MPFLSLEVSVAGFPYLFCLVFSKAEGGVVMWDCADVVSCGVGI